MLGHVAFQKWEFETDNELWKLDTVAPGEVITDSEVVIYNHINLLQIYFGHLESMQLA